jgi:error-prone DNA polymerase
MHLRSRRRLQDALTAIRLGLPVGSCGLQLYPNGERHLRLRARLAQVYSLSLLKKLKNSGPLPFFAGRAALRIPGRAGAGGRDAASHLRRLSFEGMQERFRAARPPMC